MPIVNHASREIIGKIVYYGPGLGGKTTNLEKIYEHVDPAKRGRMVSLQTDQDRTLLFDMMPLQAGTVKGFTLKFQLYTVPGQVYYNASRRKVLASVDGVVFVADSQASRLEANVESMQNLYDNLDDLGLDPDRIPLVLQYNKRDVPGALPVETLQSELNPEGVPAWQAVAIRSAGVFETLGEIMRKVNTHLRQTI